MNIYVGNLAAPVTAEDLTELFGIYGQVESANVVKNNYNGMSKGYGFVEMPDNSEADKAMKKLNGVEFKGNRLKLSQARPKSDKRRRGRRRF
ncbi:RNA-binding protein [candidate division KSB1 bacterium]|nr:RNA-binding protein [candidate division KSB1 bacterium]